ncbi:MAG: S-methyl-5-thioribose-1-phosphate isomerase [Acidimicrobiales bacterium]
MKGPDPLPATVAWNDGAVRLVDQRRLPGELAFVDAATVDQLCAAIRDLVVRGAPALGVAGAMGIALAAATHEDVDAAARRLLATRPTAVNLRRGVEQAVASADPLAEARRLHAEDVDRNRRLGRWGASLLAEGARVLTHCNAGSLACAGYGTALGVVRAAHEAGRRPSVWVGETRPVLQGSRLTAWELVRLGIPATVVVDGAAGSLMAAGRVDCVVVGADRVAANGDVANKIGTYSLAVLAHHHGIPFLVAAPVATLDPACPTGAAVPIEERGEEEVAVLAGHRVVPDGTAVHNPAFDVTPAGLVTAIVTEEGVVRPPFPEVLARLTAATTVATTPDAR